LTVTNIKMSYNQWMNQAMQEARRNQLNKNLDFVPELNKHDSENLYQQLNQQTRREDLGMDFLEVTPNNQSEKQNQADYKFFSKEEDSDEYEDMKPLHNTHQDSVSYPLNTDKPPAGSETVSKPPEPVPPVEPPKADGKVKRGQVVPPKLPEKEAKDKRKENSPTGAPVSDLHDFLKEETMNENKSVNLQKRKPTRSVDLGDLKTINNPYVEAKVDTAGATRKAKEAPVNNKNKLLDLMMRLFQGEPLYEDHIDRLSIDEKYILSSLVKRKFGISVLVKETNRKIADIINVQKELAKSKRLEENYKLVFKKALKYLMKKFKKVGDVKAKKTELEHQFYSSYFEEVFRRENLEGEMGIRYEGKAFKGQALFNPKTINTKYVSNIMKSNKFHTDFTDFLEHHFLDDYKKTRQFKIQKVVEKCYECFGKKKGSGGFDEVQKYIEQNPKCKLPWSDIELVHARDSVKMLLYNKVKKNT
jgi:DNA-dependent RNA polymerase auxiliary subunit epsilon